MTQTIPLNWCEWNTCVVQPNIKFFYEYAEWSRNDYSLIMVIGVFAAYILIFRIWK